MALTIIERNVQLDVYDHDLTPSTIKAIALDSKTRYVGAEIHNGGQTYDVGQDTGVTLTIIRPDKTGVQITGETFQYTIGDGETVYGAYAELTQTALAVSGILKAQFMLTSGDQILRTEIFSINNGVALDATVSEWAGEYQGYNLDELVQNVNTAVGKVDAMEQDVSELKSGLSELQDGGYVADAQKIQEKIDKYLDEHPEATTTVEDGAITEAKLSDILKLSAIKDYVTPQMFGAKGDGTTDDTLAIQEALNIGKYIVFPAGTYKTSSTVYLGKDARKQVFVIDASAAIIQYTGTGNAFDITDVRNCRMWFGIISATSGTCIYMHSTENTHTIQYVDMSFKRLLALNDCINAYQSGEGWINEVRIRDGRLESGINGVYINENAGTRAMDGWHFEDIGIEGVTNGFNLNGNGKGIKSFFWSGCRFEESHDKLFVTSGLVYNCVFVGAHSYKVAKYDFSSNTNNFLFICPLVGAYPALIAVVVNGQAFSFDDLHKTLGGGINIPENSDLNTYTKPGNYIIPSYAIANTISNIPEKRNGKLTVEYFGNFYGENYRYFKQTFTPYNSYVYERTCEYVPGTDTATYTDWEKIYTSKNDGLSTCTLGTKVSQKVNRVTRRGNTVELSLRLTATEENLPTDVLATIPEGYRPTSGINAMAHRSSINNNFKNTMIYVGSNGAINLFGASAKFTNDADGDLIVELTYLS